MTEKIERRAGVPREWRPGALMILALVLAGCATSQDIREHEQTMLAETRSLHARQDSLERQIAQLREVLLDSLQAVQRRATTQNADLKRELGVLEEMDSQLLALAGQSQQIISQMRERAGAAGPAPGSDSSAAGSQGGGSGGAASSPTANPAGPQGGAGGGSPRQLYEASLEQFRRGSYETARSGLEEFLKRYPDDDLAPDAQYYLAETYAQSKQPDQAIKEYARLLELYPNSRRAPSALYKSGRLELQRGNVDDARSFFSRVIRGYPNSDEASLAKQQLEQLKSK